MSQSSTHRQRWLLVAGVLGIWLGIHALRSYLAMSVWNLADELPLQLKSLPPLVVHALGLLAWPAARLAGGPRPALRFGLLFAAATAARQLLGDFDLPAAVAAFLAWIFFLWWLPAYLGLLGRQRLVLPVAAVLGVSLQVAGQTVLHGLDVPLLRGGAAWLLGLLLSGAFALSLVRAPQVPPDEPQESVSRSTIAFLGAWLFLELTLFANLGRVQLALGSGLIQGSLLVQCGIVLGLLALAFSARTLRLAAAILLLILVPIAPALTVGYAWLLVPAHAAGIMLLFGAGARGRTARRSLGYPAVAVGGALLFVFLFGFYTRYEAPGLWTAAAVLLAVLGVGAGSMQGLQPIRAAAITACVALLAAAGTLLPARNQTATPANLRVLTYNIHQGYDAAGLPGMQGIADVIAASGANVVALQEVSRGWNLLGGADLISYLHWRFPAFEVVFVPTNGRLWGNAILARMPVLRQGGATFTATEAFHYGYAFATVQLPDDTLRIYSVHLSADLQERVDEIRTLQARELVDAVPGVRSVIAGDFNAAPGTPVLGIMVEAGFSDVAAQFDLGTAATWPASRPAERLDYILASPDLSGPGTRLLITTASDHLPVLVNFGLPRTGRRTP